MPAVAAGSSLRLTPASCIQRGASCSLLDPASRRNETSGMTSQFAFLQAEFPEVFAHATKAENLAQSDPRAACFYARLALEVAVKWLYAHDGSLRDPYETTLSARIHEPTFRTLVGQSLAAKARIIKDIGNTAVHETRPVAPATAVTALRELFHIAYWLTRTYARGHVEGGVNFPHGAE